MPDYIITLQPTSPLRIGIDIDKSIQLISDDPGADSLVSVIEVPHNFTPHSIMDFDGKYLQHYIKEERITKRQEKPIFYGRNGAAIYITNYNLLMNEKRIIGKKCLPYFMPWLFITDLAVVIVVVLILTLFVYFARSQVAAILLLVVFILDKFASIIWLFLFPSIPQLYFISWLCITLIWGLVLIYGIMATFVYHRLKRQQPAISESDGK